MNSPAKLEAPLVVGYGSPLRGDDAVGLHAARILARRGCRALAVHQLTPELAEPIARAGTVIFVDADARLAPGAVAMVPIDPAPRLRGAMAHHATPEGLLALARALYHAAPEAWRVGIGGQDYGLGRSLSHAARRGLRQAVAEVMGRLNPDAQSHPTPEGRIPSTAPVKPRTARAGSMTSWQGRTGLRLD